MQIWSKVEEKKKVQLDSLLTNVFSGEITRLRGLSYPTPHRRSVTFERHSCRREPQEAGRMFKKILNKKKEETDSSSDSEDETVPHVGRKEKKSSVASLKEKLGGGPTKKESKSSVRPNYGSCW